jgi:NitT/TauT family transport system substrate-binding protein
VKRTLLTAGLLAALAAAVAGSQTPVRILAPQSTSALPLLRLAEQDPLPGIDLRCEFFLSHPQALALLLRGDAHLMLTGTSQGWENYLAGGPLVMVNTGVWGVSSLVGAAGSAPLKTLSDLAGKRVALPFPGSPLDFQTRCILARQGVNPDRDLKLSYLAFGQSVPLLLKGQLDAAPLPEPLATDLTETRGLVRLLDYRQAWAAVAGGDPRSPQVSLFVTRAYADKNAALLRRLAGHWARATEEVAADPAGAARAYAAALNLDPALLAKAIGYTLLWVPGAEENRRRVVEYYEAVREYLPDGGGVRRGLEADFFLPGNP